MSGPFAGRYTIERELGRGATANVYLAHGEGEGPAVAIKVLKPELAETLGAERFLREIKLNQPLRHPNILPVLDSGEHNGMLYFVMPLMEKGTLRQRLERERQLSIDDAISVTRAIADALGYAHKQGLLHRDVKPENILFSNGNVCLADFGIARAIERSMDDPTTSTGVIRGTPAYMSPEQASGEHDYDGRSDLYSLACVLYEMVAGMPAFIGPTPKAVMAQRFHHAPRPVTVYRPNAPAPLEAALQRALQLEPADRFRSAAEFSKALTDNSWATSQSPGSSLGAAAGGAGAARRYGRFAVAGGVAVGVLVIALLGKRAWPSREAAFAASDTTRVVILPLEGTRSGAPRWRDEDLMQQALSRWRGVQVVDQFQVADALRRSGPIQSVDDAASLSRSLGAGRYIRGSLTPFGNSWRSYVALYDVKSSQPLYSAVQQIPGDLTNATLSYSRLADSLLLRGANADSIPGNTIGTRSLPAVQAFGRAQLALDQWDLSAADSAFQAAAAFDPDYARASLWLAQVHAWRDPPRANWESLAERAIALSPQLSERERQLANALLLLAQHDYSRACQVYDRIRARNPQDFAAWFGLGQCRMMDRIVVPDPKSPSGWRFRSSAGQAMKAYAKAFEILPSVHRGYERGAFERLRDLLLVSTDLHSGYGVTDSAVFYARPAWIGDTLALIPYPWQLVFAGDKSSIPPGFQEALARRRAEFKQIAAGWSSAFPKSSGAKEAVAISLELLGDTSSIDTLRLARSLTSDSLRKMRLAASEVLMLTKFGAPDNLARLRAARTLADSLLGTGDIKSSRKAEALAPLAAMSGRCAETENFVRLMVPLAGFQRIPAALIGDANALLTRIAMGCPLRTLTVRSVSLAIGRAFSGANEGDRRRVEQTLLQRMVILAPTLDPLVTSRVAGGSESDLLVAANAVSHGDRAAARAALLSAETKVDPGILTPDVTLARARLWLSVGDTTKAIKTLDMSLESIRTYDTQRVLDDAVNAATLVSAMILRAELATKRSDGATSRRWSSAAGILWLTADPEVRPGLQRPSQHAGGR